jgi:hypothetical protein
MADYTLNAEPGQYRITGSDAKFWLTATFAPAWYTDAIQQSKLGASRDTVRREIIFAVCAAESYLLEWVRDEVLKREFEQLEKYFPPGGRQGIRERWKDVVKQLATDGRIPHSQSFGGSVWQDFDTLVNYRDGLVHGRTSRPHEVSQPEKLKPFPSGHDLDQTLPGWAVGVVNALVDDLHQTVGTAPPSWLVSP